MKRTLNLIIALIAILFAIFTIVWADSTGVWHRAEDIRGGTFGGDEQPDTSEYTFINPVNVNSTLRANVIASNNANGNVIIQLG